MEDFQKIMPVSKAKREFLDLLAGESFQIHYLGYRKDIYDLFKQLLTEAT